MTIYGYILPFFSHDYQHQDPIIFIKQKVREWEILIVEIVSWERVGYRAHGLESGWFVGLFFT